VSGCGKKEEGREGKRSGFVRSLEKGERKAADSTNLEREA